MTEYSTVLAEIHQEIQPHLNEGRVADYIPELANADPDLELAAVVERPGREVGLGAQFQCAETCELVGLMPDVPGAVVLDHAADCVLYGCEVAQTDLSGASLTGISIEPVSWALIPKFLMTKW
mgnify:CR=1 FL=1